MNQPKKRKGPPIGRRRIKLDDQNQIISITKQVEKSIEGLIKNSATAEEGFASAAKLFGIPVNSIMTYYYKNIKVPEDKQTYKGEVVEAPAIAKTRKKQDPKSSAISGKKTSIYIKQGSVEIPNGMKVTGEFTITYEN